ncbi:MAG: CD1375 family protein [Candidatus Ventricola sp.]
MMAMLWAQQIMLGKRTFSQTPARLREQVRELLEDSGAGGLAQA